MPIVALPHTPGPEEPDVYSYQFVLTFDPADPTWPDRDRFVLSAGHASILQYSLLYLTGHGLELDDIRWDAGEIVVRGPNVMKGYWKRPDETEKTLRNGWLHTGDIGRFDQEGYLYIVDRKKDMIISGGFNVYPTEVENALTKHPAISEVGVFGIPDDQWGETVCAHIVLNPGESAEAEEIIDFAGNHLARYKKPRRIEFVSSLPRTPSGKVLRRQLREPYWQGQDRKV